MIDFKNKLITMDQNEINNAEISEKGKGSEQQKIAEVFDRIDEHCKGASLGRVKGRRLLDLLHGGHRF